MALTQISTAGVKDDAVTSGKIPANAVGSSELADNAVDTAAIVDDAVNNDKIANSAVNTNQLADSAVHTQKINDDAVTTAKLANSIVNDINANSAKASITLNNNADNRVITGSGTANTLNGESNVVIDANGKLGIGTASPGQLLHVYNSATDSHCYLKVENNRSRNAAVQFTTSQGSWYVGQGVGADVDRFMVYDSAERFSIDSGGHARIYDGNLEIGTNGHGIDFSATANASGTGATMSNELLDHYEEGAWTPTWTPASGSFTALYYSGSYTRVGNVVTCIATMSINGSSSPSGEVKIGGLPFTVLSLNSSWSEKSGGGVGRWLYSGPNHYSFLITTTNEDLRVFKADGTFLNSSNLSTGYNTSQFSFVITYITDA